MSKKRGDYRRPRLTVREELAVVEAEAADAQREFREMLADQDDWFADPVSTVPTTKRASNYDADGYLISADLRAMGLEGLIGHHLPEERWQDLSPAELRKLEEQELTFAD